MAESSSTSQTTMSAGANQIEKEYSDVLPAFAAPYFVLTDRWVARLFMSDVKEYSIDQRIKDTEDRIRRRQSQATAELNTIEECGDLIYKHKEILQSMNDVGNDIEGDVVEKQQPKVHQLTRYAELLQRSYDLREAIHDNQMAGWARFKHSLEAIARNTYVEDHPTEIADAHGPKTAQRVADEQVTDAEHQLLVGMWKSMVDELSVVRAEEGKMRESLLVIM